MLHSPAQVEAMFRTTAGEEVRYGGVTTWGHHEHEPAEVFAGDGGGIVAVGPRVEIADCRLPGVGTDRATGTVEGVGVDLTVGNVKWTVSNVLPGSDTGQILLLLTNPRDGD